MPFINGQFYVTPTAVVTLNSSNFGAPSNIPGLGLLLIGPATDGQPNTPLVLSSPAQALAVLKGGDLCQACMLAFAPSSQVTGVNQITVLRPELATQATSAIGTVINLTTTSYGTLANMAKWMVQTGSTGFNVSLASDFVGPGGATYPTSVGTSIGLNGISIWYSGTGTAPKVSVSDTALVCQATTSQTGGTVTFTATMTIQQLVNQINGFAGWNATALDPNTNDLVTAYFDYIATLTAVGTTSGTAVTFTANVWAVVNWINSTNSYFTAVRTANPVTVPVASSWTYATGGTTPAAVNANWTSCYTTAQALNGIGIVTPVVGAAAIWAMNDAHCNYMSGIGKARIGYVGDLVSQTIATETTNALALNSQYTSMVWPEQLGININGVSTTFAPYLIAAQIAGARAGNPPPQALTNVSFNSGGMGQTLTATQVAQANAAGIACMQTTSTGGIILSWDRTTWLQGSQFNMVENLSHLAAAMIVSDLQMTLNNYKGPAMTAQRLGHLQNDLFSRLTFWYQQGLIAVAPVLANIQLTCSGQVVSGSASAAIIIPANYLALTLNAVAFSGMAGSV